MTLRQREDFINPYSAYSRFHGHYLAAWLALWFITFGEIVAALSVLFLVGWGVARVL